MSWAHLHLALNHVPVIGLPIVLLLLAWAMVRRSPELTKASLGLLVLLAIVTTASTASKPKDAFVSSGLRRTMAHASNRSTMGSPITGTWFNARCR